jgi:hypothetical protein
MKNKLLEILKFVIVNVVLCFSILLFIAVSANKENIQLSENHIKGLLLLYFVFAFLPYLYFMIRKLAKDNV